MALLASLFALAGRFLGRIVSTALNWASTLLFGRVPSNRRLLLGAVAIGSLAWAITALGVLLPRVGTFLLTAVPAPGRVSSDWLRLVMLAAAALLPLAIGFASRYLVEPGQRPRGVGMARGILRGYPLALVLAAVLVFIGVIAVARRLRTLVLRWSEAHIPVVVMPGGYLEVVADLESALEGAGVEVDREEAPIVLELPTRLVGMVGGRGVRALLPERLLLLRGRDLEVLVYPSDVAISGSKEQVARARAATATRLTFSRAYLTSDPNTQAVEDLLARIRPGHSAGANREPAGGSAGAAVADVPGQAEGGASRGLPGTAPAMPAVGAGAGAVSEPGLSEEDRRILAEVDRQLATLEAPYEEWEVLYRIRLQVERDLLRNEGPRVATTPLPRAC